MKLHILFMFAAYVLIAYAQKEALSVDEERMLNLEFQLFKLKHNKSYKDKAEELKRYANFKANKALAEKTNNDYNAGKISYKLGINKFSDLSREEFKSKFTRFVPPNDASHIEVESGYESSNSRLKRQVDFPDFLNLTDNFGAVRDQGPCDSAWAFAAVGILNYYYKETTGKRVVLSEQELVDCSYNRSGCNGGNPRDAFEAVVARNGINLNSVVPYKQTYMGCIEPKGSIHFSDLVWGKVGNETAMIRILNNFGPIAAGVDSEPLQTYEAGIIDDVNYYDSQNIDHFVIIVGYGTTKAGIDYWILRNSWGSIDWGVNGYFRIIRGVNMLGIRTMAFYIKNGTAYAS